MTSLLDRVNPLSQKAYLLAPPLMSHESQGLPFWQTRPPSIEIDGIPLPRGGFVLEAFFFMTLSITCCLDKHNAGTWYLFLFEPRGSCGGSGGG